jgi:adenosylcobyric acid synthase
VPEPTARPAAVSRRTRALFVAGTASHVGKSLLAAGLCRLLARRGVKVAPFKAQNMSNNSFVTPEGGEVGRAQALQAQAAGVEPHVDMNPILLKPAGERGSQVVALGRALAHMSVAEYYAAKPTLWKTVADAYDRLASRFDVVVMEGAGSCAEINLRPHDIVNFRAAEHADADVLLVADIDRGGVFAQVIGTLGLLEPAERRRVFGVAINKFRGERSLLEPGLRRIEELTGAPVLGVLPYERDLGLDQEDSLGLEDFAAASGGGEVVVAAIRPAHISNFTDLEALRRVPGTAVRLVERPGQLAGADLLVLPGTKQTVDDLEALRENGLAEAIIAFAAAGGRVLGLCGGYQMLGREIVDEAGVESGRRRVPGLGLLDVVTHFEPAKCTSRVRGRTLAGSPLSAEPLPVEGYQIHMGRTRPGPTARPWLELSDGDGAPPRAEGAADPTGRVLGTYCHGLLDGAAPAAAIINLVRRAKGLPPVAVEAVISAAAARTRGLDRLADLLERHLDLARFPPWWPAA